MKLKIQTKNKIFGFTLVLPTLIFIFTIIVYPLIMLLTMSVYHYESLKNPVFCGLENYIELLKDPIILLVLKNTLIYVGITVLFTLLIGLGMALALNSNIRGRSLFRIILLLPAMLPSVVTILIFFNLFHPRYGLIPYVLSFFITPPSFLVDVNYTLYTCTFVSIWESIPFVMLVLLAGLESLPREIFEAAKIDRASFSQTLKYITLPLLKPTILVALLIVTMDTFMVFSVPYILTQGGPGYASETITIHLYKISLFFFQFGKGAALAVIHTIIVLSISLIYLKILRR